jgi:hypothetical protein
MVKQSVFAEWSPALEVAIYSDTWMAGTKEAAALALQENKPFLREAKAPMGSRLGQVQYRPDSVLAEIYGGEQWQRWVFTWPQLARREGGKLIGPSENTAGTGPDAGHSGRQVDSPTGGQHDG